MPVTPSGLSNLGRSLAEADRAPLAPPLVVVPGFALGCLHGGAGEWDAWTRELAERYSPSPGVHVFNYDACASNVETAALLDTYIAIGPPRHRGRQGPSDRQLDGITLDPLVPSIR